MSVRIGQAMINNRWVREIFIFIFLILITFLNDREDFSHEHAWVDGLFVFSLLYIHFQIHRFFILPFLEQAQYTKYIFFTVSTIVAFTMLSLFIDYHLTNVGWFDNLSDHRSYLIKFYLFSFAVTVPMLIAINSLFKQYENKIKREEERYLLRDMELRLLKEQSSPHFLFNALNSMYGLSLEKPNELPEKILQMSDILRYQIHSSRKESIALSEELVFLKHYIDFESERIQRHTVVRYNTDDFTLTTNYRIAPMLMIFFVENAFKHVAPSRNKCFIDIQISFVAEKLMLKICNTFDYARENPYSLKVGLPNVEKRLRLLYPSSSELSIEKKDGVFEVKLVLSLT